MGNTKITNEDYLLYTDVAEDVKDIISGGQFRGI